MPVYTNVWFKKIYRAMKVCYWPRLLLDGTSQSPIFLIHAYVIAKRIKIAKAMHEINL